MILAIDIGNTNIKLGLFDGDKLAHSWKMSTDVKRTADETAAIMKQLFASENVNVACIDDAIMSSVIPQLNYSMLHALSFYFKLRPLMVEAGVKTGLAVKYESPKELGSDRIVNCVAAIKKYGAPFILVDYGTATTYNVVNSKNEFLGGCICAGIKTCIDALAKNTAQLPMVEISAPSKMISRNTINAIQAGVICGTVGETKYILERLRDELDDYSTKTIATGGLSELVYKQEKLFDIVDRELSLSGLKAIYDLNADLRTKQN